MAIWPRLIAVIAVLTGPGAGIAQTIVTSAAPDRVSVTIYRAPHRGGDEPIDRDDPEGYALITETRTITLPAGRAIVRFEGVAGNIFPASAIIRGLPGDVREKNLDADLLSPRSLYDRALGRRVILKRTNHATGKVTEQQAIIRSGADGAAVLTTADGVETLRCSGLAETIIYPEVPPGLSPRPTLSIETESATPVTATITLAYLAGGFDWQADYVLQLRGDGRADLIGYLTLASSDVTSFAGNAQVVAGEPNRESDETFGDYQDGELNLTCEPVAAPPPPPPPPPPPMPEAAPVMMRMEAQDVIVTGTARKAVLEALGDLKLYRIEDPVTVAAKAQKQVGLLEKKAVPVTLLYRASVGVAYATNPTLIVRALNKREAGLGLPIPAGRVAVFEGDPARPIFAGDASVDDRAISDKVEFKLGDRPQVRFESDCDGEDRQLILCTAEVTNANAWPIAFEAAVDREGLVANAALAKVDGDLLWRARVPANGSARITLRYRRPR